MRVLRFPLVVFGFVVDRLRRNPAADWVVRRSFWVATGLMFAALAAFIAWGLQPTPERVTLADLRAGKLPPTSSWIIISGEVVAEPPRASGLVYRLTDDTAANSWMVIHSDVALPVGPTTVSGRYFGQRDSVPEGYMFIGQMRADAVLAPELPPPWLALALAAACLVVGIAGRLSYPMFFSQAPVTPASRTATLPVNVRRHAPSSVGQLAAGTLRLQPGVPIELRVPGIGEQVLRLGSRHTGVEVGELHRLFDAEPALRVHRPVGDLDISFASRDDRDAAFAALAADARDPVAPSPADQRV
jgi:hypothetical protein